MLIKRVLKAGVRHGRSWGLWQVEDGGYRNTVGRSTILSFVGLEALRECFSYRQELVLDLCLVFCAEDTLLCELQLISYVIDGRQVINPP